MTHYAIIGDGGAGATAAFYIRQSDPQATITIYSDDPNAAYYRAALTNYLIGELRESQLFATPPDFYQTNKVERLFGKVLAVDAKDSRLTFDDGQRQESMAYDQLLIAAGASPNKPAFPGADLPGVMTMRTLQDARTVMDQLSAKRIKQAVVVGAGPLGIEWAQGLLHHQVKVTYLLRSDMFFGNALDRTGSDLVISRLRAESIDVRTNEEIAEAVAGRDGRLHAVKLKNSGETLECQLVGAAIGISPNTAFLKDSGIEIPVDAKRGTVQGIKVNEAMRTNIDNAYAAGDIIYRTMGLWEPARLQGRVAGRNMAGGSDTYRQGVHYNATRLYDLDFAGVGEVTESPGDRVLIDFPRGSGRVAYRKIIVRDGLLVGAIMLGQRKERVRKYGMHFKKMIDQKMDISAIADRLLDPSFDLTAWMDSYKIGDQIEAARQIKGQAQVPSIADMRMTRNALSMSFSLQPAKAPETSTSPEESYLFYGSSRVVLKDILKIGRSEQNDVVLNDPEVSGQHARIYKEGSAYVLEDMRSSNGTYLNGERINAPVRLVNGVFIKLGGVKMQFTGVEQKRSESPRMTSIGLPAVEEAPAPQSSDPVWGYLQTGGRNISLQMLTMNLGRDSKAEIPLNDPAISYKHAHLVRQGSETYLLDLGSRNGTLVNGKRISAPHRLVQGDVIKLGDTSLVYHSGSLPPSIRPAAVPPNTTAPAKPAAPQVRSELPDSVEAVSSPLTLSLVVRSGSLSGKSFALNHSPFTIGRDPASHIVMNDGTASWRHASFKQEDMKWFIRDLGSSNHTFLNGEELLANQPYPVKRGDQIRIGETTLEVI